MNKQRILILLFVLFSSSLIAQEFSRVEGKVSYVSIQQVYVRFESTKNINVKDTLEIFLQNTWKKALLVESISSKSCVTIPLIKETIPIGTLVAFNLEIHEKATPLGIAEPNRLVVAEAKPLTPNLESPKEDVPKEEAPIERKQTFDGRFSVSTNGSRDIAGRDFDRIRSTFSFDINRINGGRTSFETYVIYSKRLGENLNSYTNSDDFKVYSLALSHEIGKHTLVSAGRKLSLQMANMGAIDGIQIETKLKRIGFGAFGGTRPDQLDYGFNPNLIQFGGFIAHEIENKQGPMQSSLAIAEQKNQGATDRRFAYFQHNNSLIKNLNFFYSVEVDLYQRIDSVATNQINLTSTYLSLRYKPSQRISFTTSYDNRRNVIYYETYRSYLDQLINQETRHGLRLQINYKVSKFIYANGSGFYRYQSNKTEPTKNYVANLSFSQLPGLKAMLNLNANWMNTYYFNGTIYGVTLNKDLFNGFLSTELSYRKVDYTFVDKEQPNMLQDIISFSANMYTKKRTSLMLSYEGTFEPTVNYGRYYITLTQRFRNKK
jgi:hypothetical protein